MLCPARVTIRVTTDEVGSDGHPGIRQEAHSGCRRGPTPRSERAGSLTMNGALGVSADAFAGGQRLDIGRGERLTTDSPPDKSVTPNAG